METENKENQKNIKKIKNIEKPQNKKTNTSKTTKELNALKTENASLNEKVLRISAESQNMKRRYEEEISRIRKYDGEELAKRIIVVADNLERAIKLDDNDLTDELSKFLSGFKMIYTNLLSILNDFSITEIDCNKKEFDPNTMEAVLTSKEKDIPKNQVLEVLQKGYMYKDKLLRPAMVKVSE